MSKSKQNLKNLGKSRRKLGLIPPRGLTQEPPPEPEITRPASVEQIMESDGIRFVVSFSFKVPTGRTPFQKIADKVDTEITYARNTIHKKVAQKLGAKLNFLD